MLLLTAMGTPFWPGTIDNFTQAKASYTYAKNRKIGMRGFGIIEEDIKMQVLEDLYIGNIHPSERGYKNDSQYGKALEETVKCCDMLIGTLTEKQKELFENYMTAKQEVNALTDCETFCAAFKLGAKIMMDILTDTPIKKI